MLLKDIPGVLTREQLAKALMLISHVKYVDGRATGATIGQSVKKNQQMQLAGKEAHALVDLVRDALLDREEFTGAVFPHEDASQLQPLCGWHVLWPAQ